MTVYQRVEVDERKIAAGLARARKAFARDVVRIRFNLGEDWTGDPAVYIRVVLTDEASEEEYLYDVAPRVRSKVRSEIKVEEIGLHPYISFRSQSETVQYKDACGIDPFHFRTTCSIRHRLLP